MSDVCAVSISRASDDDLVLPPFYFSNASAYRNMPPVERFQLAANVSRLALRQLSAAAAEPAALSAEQYEAFDEVANYADTFIDLDHLKRCFRGATVLAGFPSGAVELPSCDVHLLINRADSEDVQDDVIAVVTRNESNGPYASDAPRRNKVMYASIGCL